MAHRLFQWTALDAAFVFDSKPQFDTRIFSAQLSITAHAMLEGGACWEACENIFMTGPRPEVSYDESRLRELRKVCV
jgi:hypothetical protein